MTLPITQEQLRNYQGDQYEILLYSGRDELDDPFGAEWNKTVLEFSETCRSRSRYKYGLEALEEQFDFYENSPLNRYCCFTEFFEILRQAELENQRQLEFFLSDHQYFYPDDDKGRYSNVKDMILIILRVSRSPEEIHLSISKLFTALYRFQGSDKSDHDFKDYILNTPPCGSSDIREVIQKEKGLLELWDEMTFSVNSSSEVLGG